MNWKALLSLKRYGDTESRPRLLQDETRLGFEVDYDRIIFSGDFRSLQDKTQVVPLSEMDFVHTRLTHSLEVSVVGRTLGRLAGNIVLSKHPELKKEGYKIHDFGAIVAAAALAHDIGNPPFGHGGERAISDYFAHGNGKKFHKELSAGQWRDLTHFEGNANGFRLLVHDRPYAPGGLRLSYATLGAFMKYPGPSFDRRPSPHIATKKYGVFRSELPFFEELSSDLGLRILSKETGSYYRHPLSYLVEAADDICYTIIDFEDAINLGYIPEEKALEYMIKIVRNNLNREKFSSLPTRKERVGYLRALAIQSLIYDATGVFDRYYEQILTGEFSTSLLAKGNYSAQLDDIIHISKTHFYRSREVVEKELKGYRAIQFLLDVFIDAAMGNARENASGFDRLVWQILPEKFKHVPPDGSLYEILLNITSYIAGMSDEYALRMYGKLK